MGRLGRGHGTGALRVPVPCALARYPGLEGLSADARFRPGSGRLDDKADYGVLTYEKSGFVTTANSLATDQFGTQLDPPAHWHPCFPAIDELPATLALRKLAVISIADQVSTNVNDQLSAADMRSWERRHGRIPAGSVVMVRSDWSKRWADPAQIQPADGRFPG